MKTAFVRLMASLRGLSTDSITLILVFGLLLGIFPFYGVPTVLCLLAAPALRLNPVALQMVNVLASPLQVLLLIPMARLGSEILGPAALSSHSLLAKTAAFSVAATTGWLAASVPVGVVLYFALPYAVRPFRRRWLSTRESPAE